MFENLMNIFKKTKKSKSLTTSSKNTAKERLHLVLMQDRANVSADFLDLMREEIIEVIKKYIDIDENSMDVRLTNQANDDGTQGAPALYANIPILNIKEKARVAKKEEEKSEEKVQEKAQEKSEKEDKTEDEDLEVEKKVEEKIEEAKKIEEQVSTEKEENTNKESENE